MRMIKELNEYLKEVIANNNKCSQCQRNHCNICFFAYECIKNNFNFYVKEKSQNLVNEK